MGRGADVHVGVVEHEVVEVDQLTVEPAAASVKWVRATKPARIGLLASRSSSRANESSALASVWFRISIGRTVMLPWR
jgi:hypothetical protein